MAINSAARTIQIQTFEDLIGQSYDQLRRLPDEKYLPLPETARGTTVCVRKKELRRDEIEIEVELRQRFLMFFHGTLRKSFRINSAGVVLDQEYETYRRPPDAVDLPAHLGLPEGVEHDLVAYLREEFGEHEGMLDALQVSDLAYVGSSNKGKKTIHYWKLRSERPMWGTVTNDSGRLHFGTSSSAPAVDSPTK